MGANGVPDNIGYLGGDFKGILDNAEYIRDDGIHGRVDHADRRQPGRGFHRRQPDRRGLLRGPRQDRLSRLLGRQLLPRRRAPRVARASLRRLHAPHAATSTASRSCSTSSATTARRRTRCRWTSRSSARSTTPPARLRADHQNLRPEQLDPSNPLHRWFHREPDLAELSNLDDTNPEVMDYLAGAYLQWIDQGAARSGSTRSAACRTRSGREFTRRIRAQHPGFFMFGEDFNYDARSDRRRTRGRRTAASACSTSR